MGFGAIFMLLAIPFLPRQETRTPILAVGAAIVYGAMLPLLLPMLLFRYAPWWYWLKWVEYREFLIETKITRLKKKFESFWNISWQKKFPEEYMRQKEWLESDLGNLNTKVSKLNYRKRLLEDKLRKGPEEIL